MFNILQRISGGIEKDILEDEKCTERIIDMSRLKIRIAKRGTNSFTKNERIKMI